MIDEPDLPRQAWWRGARERPLLSPAPDPASTGADDPPGVPPAAPPPLDEWDLGEPEVGWAAVAPPAPEGLEHPSSDFEPSAGASTSAAAPVRSAPRDARPVLVRLLRPWFEPRPGELRGAIALLAVALAISLALWFDASRRPDLVADPPSAPPEPVATASPGPGGSSGGRADGSDGWGIGAPAVVGPVVHVSGAVRTPGVVTLAEAARVADALDAAGGAMPDAVLDLLNLARVVDDGERIHVPRVGEDPPPLPDAPSRGVLPDGRIDLNAASAEELETLPGVGPARAQAIIAEREARPFRVPGDLRRVPGIGEATFQRLAPLVAVR